MLREVFKFLASLKLAIILLVVIIIAAAIGTYCESHISAEVARRYIYGNILFDLWLTMLCINLFCVAAIRYPWKPHQTGFVITHAGIIILLIGSMIDRHWGMEAFLQLHRGQPPTDVAELHQQQLVVSVDGQKEPAYTKFDVKAMDSQFEVKSPTPDVVVRVVDTKPVQAFKYFVPASAGPAAAHLRLRGPVMGQFDQWVSLNGKAELGMATVTFLAGKPPPPLPLPEAKKDPAAGGAGDAGPKEEMRARQEQYYDFPKHPEMNECKPVFGDPTKAVVKLIMDPKTSDPTLNVNLFDKEFSVPVKSNVAKEYPLDGLDGWKLYIYGYYPNFRMIDMQPASLNDNPENPAVKFDLIGPIVKAVAQAPKSPHGGNGTAPGIVPGGSAPSNALTLYLGDDNIVRYLVKSRTDGEFTGEAQTGKYVLLKWANTGAEFAVDEFFTHASQKEEWRPPEEELTPKQQQDEYDRGLKVQIVSGGETKELWLGQRPIVKKSDDNMGAGKTIVELPRESVQVGGKKIGLSFCNQFIMLPFKVGLLKFSAPTDEGTDMSFAAFESVLTFDGHVDWVQLTPNAKLLQQARNPQTAEVPIPDALNGGQSRDLFGAIVADDAAQLTMEFDNRQSVTIPKSDITEYVKKTHKIFMNYPTTFPETWYGPWLGTTYKFSQADHRMEQGDVDYSGVQVLRDPGWMPKWVGCLMICFGIFTMFYLKPYFNRRPAPIAVAQAVESGKPGKGGDKNKKKTKDGHNEEGVPGLQSR